MDGSRPLSQRRDLSPARRPRPGPVEGRTRRRPGGNLARRQHARRRGRSAAGPPLRPATGDLPLRVRPGAVLAEQRDQAICPARAQSRREHRCMPRRGLLVRGRAQARHLAGQTVRRDRSERRAQRRPVRGRAHPAPSGRPRLISDQRPGAVRGIGPGRGSQFVREDPAGRRDRDPPRRDRHRGALSAPGSDPRSVRLLPPLAEPEPPEDQDHVEPHGDVAHRRVGDGSGLLGPPPPQHGALRVGCRRVAVGPVSRLAGSRPRADPQRIRAARPKVVCRPQLHRVPTAPGRGHRRRPVSDRRTRKTLGFRRRYAAGVTRARQRPPRLPADLCVASPALLGRRRPGGRERRRRSQH